MTLSDAFKSQARSCEALGSPFMGQLLRVLAQIWPHDSKLGRLFCDWPGEDIGPNGASLPLRIAGGLHALILLDRAPGLVAVYPPNEVSDGQLGAAVLAALNDHETFLLDWVQSPPQTNEVRRCAPLIAAGHWLAGLYDLPFYVSELGASAGLNLMWDRFALNTIAGNLGPADPELTLNPDWSGPLPAAAPPVVTDRRGVDLNPLDSSKPEHSLRLMAYLWPDQPHRVALTRAAIAAQDALVDAGDAIDWLEHRFQSIPAGHLHLIYHTIAWQYFPPEAATRGTRLIESAGEQATPDNPLAWLSFEADAQADGAAITLRLWPGDQTIPLARADFHGRWVRWDGAPE